VGDYASLLAILTQEEDVISTLIQRRLAGTREQQYCRVPRDYFWTTLVEKRFSDAQYKPVVDLSGLLDDVDVINSPGGGRS